MSDVASYILGYGAICCGFLFFGGITSGPDTCNLGDWARRHHNAPRLAVSRWTGKELQGVEREVWLACYDGKYAEAGAIELEAESGGEPQIFIIYTPRQPYKYGVRMDGETWPETFTSWEQAQDIIKKANPGKYE